MADGGSRRLKALLIVPYFNRDGVGEDYSNYKWIEGLSLRHRVTVLTIARPGRSDPLAGLQVELVEFPDSRIHLWLTARSRRYEGLARQACPNYVSFYWRARAWIFAHGEAYDLVHQFSPLAMRYPSPALGFLSSSRTPFIAGPLGGALGTPIDLRRFPWLPESRWVDWMRFRWDPWLRATYRRADCLVGAAPYVQELLHSVRLRRFEVMSEMGMEWTRPRRRPLQPGRLQLLFVGRLIHRKGVIHAIRCMGMLRDLPGVSLRIVGEGQLEAECHRLVDELGIGERVQLLGRLSRAEVFEQYLEADVFLFPSYREPTGHVVYEALAFGLPVITTTVGGPAFIVNETCGRRVPPARGQAFAASLAMEVRKLHASPREVEAMASAAVRRIEEDALWPRKTAWMSELYGQVVDQASIPAK